MTKIKVSFQEDRELEAVLGLLRPAVKSCKVAKMQQGKYKRAYIELQEGQGDAPRHLSVQTRHPKKGVGKSGLQFWGTSVIITPGQTEYC